MLSEEEKKFLLYWEKNRAKEKRVFRQWIIGLPGGVILGAAIAVNFSSGWDKRATYEANGEFNPMVLVIAIVVIASFTAIFSKRLQWDLNDQKYKELKSKERKELSAEVLHTETTEQTIKDKELHSEAADKENKQS